MAACETPSPPLPPQFPRDLRAAPTLPGLANPPLEGVRLAKVSSVHRVKRSVCPKEPVNTSLSDHLHSTANIMPHYPPPEWSPRPNFRICSDRSQKKTRFGENELKMQPKLSTGYSHAAQLNKV